MTPDQFSQIVKLLADLTANINESLSRPYTLAQAADWYMAVALVVVASGLLVYIWQDLKATIKDHRQEWQRALKTEKDEREKHFDEIWGEVRRCQDKCFPGERKR